MNRDEKFQALISTHRAAGDITRSSVRAAAFTGAAGGVDFLLRILSSAVLARLLIPEHFGLVMMAMAVTAIADQFRDMGLSIVVVQRKEITHQEASNLFWVNVGVSLGLVLLLCATAHFVALYYKDARVTPIIFALASTFLFSGLMVQHQALLTRQLKLGHTSVVRLVSSVISTGLAIVLAVQDFGYWSLVWREIVRSALLTAGMWFCLPWVPGLPARDGKLKELLSFGGDLTAANILVSISAMADRFILGRIWGPESVAVFRQAYQLLVQPVEQLVAPIYQVSQPGLSMLQTADEKFRRFYQKALTLLCVATMPVSLFVAVYAMEFTLVLLGEQWLACAPVIMVLSLGVFIKQAVGSSAWVLITQGRSRVYLTLTLVQNLVVVAFMFVGAYWGALGVAVADIAATYVLALPRLHYCLKDSPVTLEMFLSATFRPAFCSALMAVVLFMVHSAVSQLNLVLSLGLGSATALVVFFGTWMLIPGGKAELFALVTEFRGAFQKKRSRKPQSDSAPAPAAG